MKYYYFPHCIYKKRVLFLCISWILLSFFSYAHQPEFSTAGFFNLDNTGRTVYSMNPAWRFHKGEAKNAYRYDFNDKDWTTLSLPNGIEYLPTEASGCINYQGEVWYRKHFTPSQELKGKKLFLHFEAIMGKSKIWINGTQVGEHFGGYLPVVIDITPYVDFEKDNVIAVWADNSNDPNYPPGKAQEVLDFTYFGGIYRDCWLIAHNDVHITDPNYENKVADGGLFVSYNNVSEQKADINLKLQIRNEAAKGFVGNIVYELYDKAGNKVNGRTHKISISKNKAASYNDLITLSQPHLWSPDSPYLYQLHVYVKNKNGETVDGYRQRIGIRSIEFKGENGFWLNGRPYKSPLIGANRHQDFAVIGNALPNSLHWRDAKKLRDAGLKVIRNAHCPQDPAFMDACDELGLFVIVNTPGWQFWNDVPIFAERVYQDIRNLVRRDRNHASVWMWEPILNETWYPADFAKNAVDVVNQEYPYPYCYNSCDSEAKGKEYFPIRFTHPLNGGGGAYSTNNMDAKISYFTREWGDNVDDWNSHNSPSRASRAWGEIPMLVQANHYANPPYKYTSYESLYQTSRQHVGGCLWHSFDHQRGYHPDPFYGGLMDVFRQPKYSYYMFQAQRSPEKSDLISETGPMVYIAHEMTPFSPKDVTIFSNCDEVRLTVFKGGKQYTYHKEKRKNGMPSPVIVFKDAYDFMQDKALSRQRKQDEVYMLAEGIMNGKVVATHKVAPARRPEKLLLWVDNEKTDLEANGSDIVAVVAAIADNNGNIKHLNNYFIQFEIEGEGRLIGDEKIMANPAPVRWGTAPILVQSTLIPGKIKIRAHVFFEGSQMPVSTELELESQPSVLPQIYDKEEATAIPVTSVSSISQNSKKTAIEQELEQVKKELNVLKLKEVEQQQEDFGEKNK